MAMFRRGFPGILQEVVAPFTSTNYTIDTATAAASEYTIDVTGAHRVIVRARGLTKSGGTTLASIITTETTGLINGTDDYWHAWQDTNSESTTTETTMRFGQSLVSSNTIDLLCIYTGIQAGVPCHFRNFVASSTTSDIAGGASAIEDTTALTEAVTAIKVCDENDFSAGTIYINVIQDSACAVSEIDFSTSNSPQDLSLSGYDLVSGYMRDVKNTGNSVRPAIRFSDSGGQRQDIYTDAYLTAGGNGSSVPPGGTNAQMDLGRGASTSEDHRHMFALWSLQTDLIGGHGFGSVRANDTSTLCLLSKMPSPPATLIEFDSYSTGNALTEGALYAERTTLEGKVTAEGSVTSQTLIGSLNVTGKSEARITIEGVSSPAETPRIQFDYGSGYDTTAANYNRSDYRSVDGSGRWRIDTDVGWFGAPTSGTTAGAIELYGLDDGGPVVGLGHIPGSSHAFYTYFGNAGTPVVGIRIQTENAEPFTGTFSIVANEYA